MNIKRKSDGTVLEFDFYTTGRGEWGYALIAVNGSPTSGFVVDPDYARERYARKAARAEVEAIVWSGDYGWHVV